LPPVSRVTALSCSHPSMLPLRTRTHGGELEISSSVSPSCTTSRASPNLRCSARMRASRSTTRTCSPSAPTTIAVSTSSIPRTDPARVMSPSLLLRQRQDAVEVGWMRTLADLLEPGKITRRWRIVRALRQDGLERTLRGVEASRIELGKCRLEARDPGRHRPARQELVDRDRHGLALHPQPAELAQGEAVVAGASPRPS